MVYPCVHPPQLRSTEVLRAVVGAGARPLRQAPHGESAGGFRGGASGDEPTGLLAARQRDAGGSRWMKKGGEVPPEPYREVFVGGDENNDHCGRAIFFAQG